MLLEVLFVQIRVGRPGHLIRYVDFFVFVFFRFDTGLRRLLVDNILLLIGVFLSHFCVLLDQSFLFALSFERWVNLKTAIQHFVFGLDQRSPRLLGHLLVHFCFLQDWSDLWPMLLKGFHDRCFPCHRLGWLAPHCALNRNVACRWLPQAWATLANSSHYLLWNLYVALLLIFWTATLHLQVGTLATWLLLQRYQLLTYELQIPFELLILLR